MTSDVLIVQAILGITILLFLSGKLRPDMVALLSLLALTLTSILTPAEAFAGFGDPTVIMIAGLFVVAAGIFRTGLADRFGRLLGRIAGTGRARVTAVLMVGTGLLSAFISTTGTVALMLPVATSLARRARLSPSMLLLPVAVGALFGGLLTLIATPPNIIVSNQLSAAGFAPFSFFDFTPVGLILLILGTVLLAFFGGSMLRPRAPIDSPESSPPGTAANANDGDVHGAERMSPREKRALAVVAGMLVLLAFEILPPATAVLLAAAAMVLTGCIDMSKVYAEIDWGTVILIAAILPMATALRKTGSVELIVALLVPISEAGPVPMLAATFFLTGMMGMFISNTATAALVAPIAMAASLELGVSPYPLLMTVAIASSTSFATPVSTPANMLVLGPGAYHFADYVRVGVPLQILSGVVAVLVVPLLFPF